MTDLEILWKLGRELGKSFSKVTIDKIKQYSSEAMEYATNETNNIIALKITGLQLNKIPVIVSELKAISIIDLSANKISDISALRDLKQISILRLNSNHIVDISLVKDLTQISTLDLSQNQIEDIIALKDLTKIVTLNLNNNKITDIAVLQHFSQIYALDLSENKITDISPLVNLRLLKNLNLSINQICDISALKDLVQITVLDLRANQIINIAPLKGLNQITTLNLHSNQITDISPLEDLKKIYTLILYRNQITDISFLKNLHQIKTLDLSENRVVDINSLEELTQICALSLYRNQIIDISVLKNLNQIKTLDLSANQVIDISALENLKLLSQLDLAKNPIKNIPIWITAFSMDIKWTNTWASNIIAFFDNPIETPPIEILKQGKQAIRDWFSANKKKLREIKILLVGEAKTGKTSLIQKLKFNKYNINQDKTDGIVIEPFKFGELPTFANQKKLNGTAAYFWDFGGQEIMSSTHQFFMTKRSVYLLVLEARKDAETDKQVRQWMERIQAFGGDSPVIIVGNKIDLNPSFGINTTDLQKAFPQIKRYINVSCQTGENIETLKDIFAEYIPLAELFNTEIDERWIKIKNELQKITGEKYKLSHEQFVDISSKYGITEKENQSHAIHFLNDLGIVLHFDEMPLAEYYVLDPFWVTGGVYRVITSDTAARQKGEIAVGSLYDIINKKVKQHQETKHNATRIIEYSPNECKYLADIMVEFKLGYYTDNHTKLLIPDLLDKETPKKESEEFYNATEKLGLIYTYKYLPSAVMPRVMVELKEDIQIKWRTGIILNCKSRIGTKAMITTIENEINIIVVGNDKQKREYLSVLRHVIDQINVAYNIEVDIQIPLPGYEKYFVKYEHLIKLERKGRLIYENLDIDKEFEISVLLDGIVSNEEVVRQADADKKIKQITTETTSRKTEIFLASSIELVEERREFEIFINRRNKELHSKRIFLHLNIWEDLSAAFSQTRSQDEYNKEILDSDITVILFFTKVGKYTEEEFEIALKRFKATGKPLIFTYFKDSSITTGGANRKDLLSLWDFQDKLKDLGHFYTVYSNTDELIRKFNDQLTKYFDELGVR